MINDTNIFEEIYVLRKKLNYSLEDKDLCDEKVLSLSREMDSLILAYYQLDKSGGAKKTLYKNCAK